MGISQLGGPAAVTYGASGSGSAVGANTMGDVSSATLTFTTTAPNTKWLIQVDADVSWGSGATVPNAARLMAKIDGSYSACSGGVGEVINGTPQAVWLNEMPVSGRCVVTLTTAASHTILPALSNGSGTTVTVQTVAITATQLAG